MANKQYLIVGSNNFWYACGIESIKEAEERITEIKKHPREYGNPETGEIVSLPAKFYIYEAREIKEIECASAI